MGARSPLLACAAVAALSCGGGGGGGSQSFSFPGNAFNDGYVTTQPAVIRGGFSVALGWDPINGFVVRGFFRFLHTGIPPSAVIDSAILSANQSEVFGDPYGVLGGGVLVDHVDMEAMLYVEDFDFVALSPAFGVLSSDATLGPKTLDVTAEVQADVTATRPYTDFRLRFPLDNPADRTLSGGVFFTDTEDAAATGLPPSST